MTRRSSLAGQPTRRRFYNRNLDGRRIGDALSMRQMERCLAHRARSVMSVQDAETIEWELRCEWTGRSESDLLKHVAATTKR